MQATKKQRFPEHNAVCEVEILNGAIIASREMLLTSIISENGHPGK